MLPLKVLAVALVSTVAILCSAASPEGGTSPPKEIAAEGQPPIAAIPLEDIPVRASVLVAELASIHLLIERVPAMQAISDDLEEFSNKIGLKNDEASIRELEGLHFQGIEDLQAYWARQETIVDEWTATVQGRFQELDRVSDRLESRRAQWDLTSQTAGKEQYPAPIVDQVETSIAAIRDELEALAHRRAEVLRIRAHLAVESSRISASLTRLLRARTKAMTSLFEPEAMPLWKVWVSDVPEDSLGEQVGTAWERRAGPIVDYLQFSRDKMLFQFLFFTSLVAGLILLRRWARSFVTDEDKALDDAKTFLGRPVSTALLIALLLTAWIHLTPPIAFIELVLLLSLIPALRLLPPLLGPSRRPAFYGMTALFVLHKLTRFADAGTTLERVALLGTTTVSLIGALWLLKRWAGTARPLTGKDRPWILLLLRSGTIALIVGLFANILGAVSLAELLTRGTLYCGYLAAIAFAGDRAINGVLAIFRLTPFVQSFGFMKKYGKEIAKRREWIVHLLMGFLWIRGVLKLFLLWTPAVAFVSETLGRIWHIGSFELSLRSLLLFLLALWGAVLISRFTRSVLEEDVYGRLDLPRGIPPTISMLVHYGIISVGFFMAVAIAGIGLTQFTIVVGALGVGIGFGLQNLVNNFVSGLILIFERPIKVGDTIEIGTMLGRVLKIGIRSSVVRTLDGAEVIVPNGNLISNDLINWTLSDRRRRVEVKIGAAYGTDPNRVLEILRKVADDDEDVSRHPTPDALFLGFGESSLDFSLRCWTSEFDKWLTVRSNLTIAVNKAFAEAGIEIPFPQRDLHVRSVDSSIVLPTTS